MSIGLRYSIGIVVLCALALGLSTGQPAYAQTGSMHKPLDEILDLYVRDGQVYYRALRMERSKLDAYVASLDVNAAEFQRWSRDQQLAFWLNAYNAFVLETVIDNYPIRGRSAEYPAISIRQISGAFERTTHRAAGKPVTLDAIEKEILPGFRDPRAYLALGRGAVGSGRLRSEAYVAERLESQLTSTTAEFVTRARHVQIDMGAKSLAISPIFSWRQAEFLAAYAGSADNSVFSTRSPLERAVLSLVLPNIFPNERDFLQENQFEVRFQDFDWRLNDLTGGRID